MRQISYRYLPLVVKNNNIIEKKVGENFEKEFKDYIY